MRARMKLVAQKPDHPPSEPHPVGQHGLGQELPDFVNARIVHAEPRIITDGILKRNLLGVIQLAESNTSISLPTFDQPLKQQLI
jgi:hypothetical protein